MPITADSITLKRLILVKQLYHQSLTQSSSQSDVNRIMAVIGFDLAVETILKVIIGALDPHSNPKDEVNFHQYRNKADQLMFDNGLNQLPHKRNIGYVHDLRNSAQHKAKYPSETEVNDSRTYVRDFLQQVLSQVWGLSIESISFTDLIQHRLVKECFTKAETLFAEPDYTQAVLWATGGLNKAIDLVRRSIVGDTRSYSDIAVMIKDSGQQRTSRGMYRSFQEMRETLLYVMLGLNYVEYLRYRTVMQKLGGHAEVYDDGAYRFYLTDGLKQIDADTAEYLIRYCIDTVVQIESRVENLAKPFSKTATGA
jgi:hypothetical protein